MHFLRCASCGQHTPHREGVRFCTACGQALGIGPCPACGRDVFVGDRHCACCGQRQAGDVAHAPAPPPAPTPTPPSPNPAWPHSVLSDFHLLAQEARHRALSVDKQSVSPSKSHLTQDDIDRLFGVDE